MPAEKWLFFVDTNVFLDFYRLPGEQAKKQLEGLLKHRESLIISEQVHMEYLKNRQKVILAGFKNIKRSTFDNVPTIFSESKFGKSVINFDKKANQGFRKLDTYASRLLMQPAQYDMVYKTAIKLFRSNHRWNLKRPDETRFEIRDLAEKRFRLGYPPKKPDDYSMGDAVNWEWIIHCAVHSEERHDIMIVSRDSDYGVNSKQNVALNDWLASEFKVRVPGRRKIVLTNRLTQALKKLDENVTPADEEAEKRLLEADKSRMWDIAARVASWSEADFRRARDSYSKYSEGFDEEPEL